MIRIAKNNKNSRTKMHAIQVFFKSMLEQLSLAHDEGNTNNIDLQEKRNIYVDPRTGRAVLFDWNSFLPIGSPARDIHQNWRIAAPEAWLEESAAGDLTAEMQELSL